MILTRIDRGIITIGGRRFRVYEYGPYDDGARVAVFFLCNYNSDFGNRAFSHTMVRGRSKNARLGFNNSRYGGDTPWGKEFYRVNRHVVDDICREWL